MFFIRALILSACLALLSGCTFTLSPLMIFLLADEPAQTQEDAVSEDAQLPEAQMSASLPAAASDNNA